MDWISATVSAVGGIAGNLYGQDKEWQAAKRNARLEYDAAMEELRRFDLQAEKNLGNIKSILGASGVTYSGTAKSYYERVDDEQREQSEYMEKMAKQRRRATRKNAEIDPVEAIFSGVSGAIGGLF